MITWFNSVFNLPESWITWDCATRWLASVSLAFRWIPTRVMLMTPPSTHRATQLNPHQWTCKSPYWLLGNTDSWGMFNRERSSKLPIPATHKFWQALTLLNAPLIFAWFRIPFGLFSGMFNLPIDKYPLHLHASNIYASVLPCVNFMWK